MLNNVKTRKLALSAMMLALAYLLPFFTGQIQKMGNMLCPMHIPVLLCGFLCGASWGLAVGFTAPLLRSLVLGMPPMFPKAICMALELAVYGLVCGLMHKIMPQKKWFVYVSLITAMIAGRLVWGAAMYICMGINAGKFGFSEFLAGAVTNAIPGIVIQLVLIPVIVMVTQKKSKRFSK